MGPTPPLQQRAVGSTHPWCGGLSRGRQCRYAPDRCGRRGTTAFARGKVVTPAEKHKDSITGAVESSEDGMSQGEDYPNPLPPDAPEDEHKRVAYFHAAKCAHRAVLEGERPLADYMALPVSQYSVLDAKQVERLDESTFKCHVGAIRFFGFIVKPIVTVDVRTDAAGCFINMLDCELDGSDVVRAASDAFGARMRNRVTWEQDGDEKRITSDTTVDIGIVVPKWFSLVPVSFVEKMGSGIVGQVLRISVPRFLHQLDKDYRSWAAGDDSRQPMES